MALRTCYIFFRKCWEFLWVFFNIFSVPYFGLACDHGNSFLCLGRVRKRRYWIEVRTVFKVKPTTTTINGNMTMGWGSTRGDEDEASPDDDLPCPRM